MTAGTRMRFASLRRVKAAAVAAAMVVASATLAGCAGVSPLATAAPPDGGLVADAEPAGASTPTAELEKATQYWGKEYAKNPRDGKAALSYAKNLKAMGRKKDALAVLAQSHAHNSQDREHLSEYGRLALELGQVSTARQLLERADDPANPDWRILSARGTVLAKEGDYKKAIDFFERARARAPDQPSVLNNLALAQAMDGEAAKAETLLRQAAQADGADPRVRHNLALVLGVQGKYAEAKKIAGTDLSEAGAQANIDYLKKIVRADPKPDTSGSGGNQSTHARADASAVPRIQSRGNAKTTSAVATSSIDTSDPEQVMRAALEAEAAKAR